MELQQDKWIDCYEGSWQGVIVPEAFVHPAKFSYSLIQRIIGHALRHEFVKRGDLIVDPFGGIGCGGIVAAYSDIRWLGVELEQKFVDLANQNFELHRKKLEALNCPQPVIIQGDSRKLCNILSEADCLISSPPYSEQPKTNRTDHGILNHPENCKCNFCKKNKNNAGMNQGYRNADLIISSPPYETDIIKGRAGELENPRLKQKNLKDNKYGLQKSGHPFESYGSSPGNLGSMKPGSVDAVVSSPPYAESLQGNENGIDFTKAKEGGKNKTGPRSKYGSQYSQTPGNLGNLKPGLVDCVLSSPPYEGSMNNKNCGINWSKAKKDYPGRIIHDKRIAMHQKHHTNRKYGNGEEQLGSQTGDTFWQAAKVIIEQCHQILKPSGVAIWVVKSFVRNKKIVDFPGDWKRLCESVGFETLHEHHAMLVKEDIKESLFGHKIVKRKERKSFFRRLAEAKGSPRIDFENVICMRKEAGTLKNESAVV